VSAKPLLIPGPERVQGYTPPTVLTALQVSVTGWFRGSLTVVALAKSVTMGGAATDTVVTAESIPG